MSVLKLLGKDFEKNESYFIQFASNVTSQGGEDGILNKLFENCLPKNSKCFCVDIGAWDGKYLSNTHSLLCSDMWNGLLVEANSDRFRELYDLYKCREGITCLCKFVDVNSSDASLNAILNAWNVPLDFDFLSIDIDGADYHLWESIGMNTNDQKYNPKVVCIEFNPSIPNNLSFIQECNCAVHQGSSLLAIVDFATSIGYELIVTTTFNAIFVRGDLFRAYIIPELIQHNHFQQYILLIFRNQ